MHPSVQNHRATIRRLVAGAGVANPRLKKAGDGPVVEILVDLRPGTRTAALQQLQAELEEVLKLPVDISTPADLAARQRADLLQQALPI